MMQLPDYVTSLVLFYCRIIYLENLPLYVIGGSLYNNKKVLSFDFVSIFSKKQIIITHFEIHKTARINTTNIFNRKMYSINWIQSALLLEVSFEVFWTFL